MNKRNVLSAAILFFLAIPAPAQTHAQQSVQYCEQRDDQDVNCYTFSPAPRAGTKGIIEKILRTEDGEWYGRAEYKATEDKITVPSFHLMPTHYVMEGDHLVPRVNVNDVAHMLYVKRLVFYKKGRKLVLSQQAADGGKQDLYFSIATPDTAR